VEPDAFGPRPVKEERSSRFNDALAQIVPGIALCEDAFRQAFGAIAAVGLVVDLEYQFGYFLIIW
jgi:hypothetical protein